MDIYQFWRNNLLSSLCSWHFYPLLDPFAEADEESGDTKGKDYIHIRIQRESKTFPLPIFRIREI